MGPNSISEHPPSGDRMEHETLPCRFESYSRNYDPFPGDALLHIERT